MKNTDNIINLVTGNIKPDNKKGMLSEISSSSSNDSNKGVSDANYGIDWFAYPNPMSISFGILINHP